MNVVKFFVGVLVSVVAIGPLGAQTVNLNMVQDISTEVEFSLGSQRVLPDGDGPTVLNWFEQSVVGHAFVSLGQLPSSRSVVFGLGPGVSYHRNFSHTSAVKGASTESKSQYRSLDLSVDSMLIVEDESFDYYLRGNMGVLSRGSFSIEDSDAGEQYSLHTHLDHGKSRRLGVGVRYHTEGRWTVFAEHSRSWVQKRISGANLNVESADEMIVRGGSGEELFDNTNLHFNGRVWTLGVAARI